MDEDDAIPPAAESPADTGSDDVQLELDAMSAVARQLATLNPNAQRRVIKWAAERFGATGSLAPSGQPSRRTAPTDGGGGREAGDGDGDGDGDQSFSSLAELFDAVQPTQQDQKALVGAYWLQAVQGAQTLTGFAINSELRQLGQEIKIAMGMSALQRRKPALVLQLRKAGKTQQARKLYKVTEAGLRVVRRAIEGGGFSDW